MTEDKEKQNYDLIGGSTDYVFGKLFFSEYHNRNITNAKAAIYQFRVKYDIIRNLQVNEHDRMPLFYRLSDAEETLEKIEFIVNEHNLFNAAELFKLHRILKTEHELIQEIIDDYKKQKED